jgi:hypothetical protein
MTDISRCCCILRLHVCRLSRGSHYRCSRILQRGGYRSGGAYCVVHSTIHWPAGGHAGGGSSAGSSAGGGVTTWYGLLHYANLIRRTGPIIFFQPT